MTMLQTCFNSSLFPGTNFKLFHLAPAPFEPQPMSVHPAGPCLQPYFHLSSSLLDFLSAFRFSCFICYTVCPLPLICPHFVTTTTCLLPFTGWMVTQPGSALPHVASGTFPYHTLCVCVLGDISVPQLREVIY